MIVMKEETVSNTGIEEYVPTSFIVEDYSEEVCESPNRLGDVNPPNELNIAQEVFIDHDQVTYEVRTIEEVIGFDVAEPADKNNESEDVFEDEPDQIQESSIVFYPESASSKKGVLKKRRGRPPKFQVSEIGNDGKKWYACTVCDEKYEDRMELMQHMRQHNAERPFHCRECGKAFKQAAHLKVHVRQHTGEKPFECTICGKGFRQKAIVDQHMRTHTQLRPYVCSYDNCDKSFAQKTSLDNHTKSHQTGRLSDAFKKQQEEQKRKSILAQEALKNKNLKPKIVQMLPVTNNKKKPVGGGIVTPSIQDKVRTTIVKMTQSQFEQYLQNRAGSLDQSPVSAATSSVKSPQQFPPKEMTNKQKTATGPFLAYVNLCKPLLQAERPELSLLEVLKELASRWNAMNKTEKQKFSIIAKQSQDERVKHNGTNVSASKAILKNLGFSASAEDESEEVEPVNSMEGAVFEIGDSTESFYHTDKQITEENYFQINEIREKSLNQNVFGKRIVLLSKDGKQRKFSNEEKLQVVTTNFDSEPLADMDQSQSAAEVTFEPSVLQFEETSDKNTVIFDTPADANHVVYENGSDLEMNNTIFYLPNIVDGEQLEVL